MLFSTWVLDLLNIEPPPLPSETTGGSDRSIPRKKLLIKALMAAVGIAQCTPPIFSGNQHTLKASGTQIQLLWDVSNREA